MIVTSALQYATENLKRAFSCKIKCPPCCGEHAFYLLRNRIDCLESSLTRSYSFHQLTEFDQGKRSCRRRLAGHNERRRKPPPGSLLSARYGRLPSSMFENSNRVGGFVMDFTAYPKHAWSAPRSSERTPGNLIHGTGKLYTHPWQSSPENPPPDLFLQCSAGGATGFPTPGIPPGECFTGVADSSCALSLLSNQQPWAPTNQASSLAAVSHMAHPEGPRLSQPVAPHSSAVNHFSAPGASWALKTNEVGSSSSTLAADLGLGQLSQPLNSQFSGELDLSQQNRRQFMELDPSRAYDSTHQMHWSL